MYDHNKMLVARVEKYTAKFLNDRANTISTRNEQTERDFPTVFVDNLPMTPQCAAFVNQVRVAMPNLKLGLYQGGDVDHHGRINSVAVYREGDTYALGRVGFRDVAVSSTKWHYFVYSRKISNSKIYGSRWQHYIKSSEKPESTLKQAKKYLVPYSPLELAGISIDEFTKDVRSERSSKHSGMRSMFRDLVMGDEKLLIAEVKKLVQDGYKFLNPKFADKVATYLSAEGAYTQEAEKRLDAYFMNIGNEDTEVVEYENMVREDTMHCDTPTPKETKVIKTEDIPFDLQLKISSLQVAEPMHYIEGLGMRVGDRTFWVQR